MVVLLAFEVSEFTERVGVPLLVALLALAAALGAAALSFALGCWADTSARRRDGYSSATQELVAWAEYPFRIRRRTSDDPAVLSALAERGHSHQEALRYRGTWIASESRWMAEVFSEIRRELAALIGPACNDAWGAEPVREPSQMTLGTWGPDGVDDHIARFERALAFRFGWRRIVALSGWHPGA